MIIPNYDPKKTDKSTFKEQHPFYTQISRTLLCGSSGSGKTNLLIHVLKEPLIYYEQITIYSKTIDQPKYKELDKFYTDLSKDYKIPIFHSFRNGSVEPVESLDKIKYKLIIFDDYILQTKEFEKMISYFVLGRHHLCNVIFLSQSYYNTPKEIRINCSNFCIFGLPTRREIRSVLTDHQGITEQQFLNNTTGFDFISINKITKKVTKNLDEELET